MDTQRPTWPPLPSSVPACGGGPVFAAMPDAAPVVPAAAPNGHVAVNGNASTESAPTTLPDVPVCPHVAAVDADAQHKRFSHKRFKPSVRVVACSSAF